MQPLKDELNESKDAQQPLKNEIIQSKEDIQRVEAAFYNKMDQLKDQIDTQKQQIKVYDHVERTESQLYQLKTVMFNLLSTKFFDKKDNIDIFNNLKGESQTFIFDSIYCQNDSNIIIKKIHDLLEYLSKENRRINYKFSKESYIYIHLNDNCKNVFEINDIETIGIAWNAIEMLYYNFSLTSYEFLYLLRSFDEFRVEIEIKYPKSEWRYIYEYISNIKETTQNINISILISDIEKTDETFQSNSKIDSIKFYSNDKELECYDKNDPIRLLLSSKSTNCLVNTIGMNSFSLCKNLREVVLSNSIKLIESKAFNECSSLTRITIPSSVTFVDEYAFNKCSNLSQITYDPYVTKLHQNAFNECSSLNHLVFYSSVVAFNSFECNSFNIKCITIPPTVKFINPYALCNMKNLINASFDSNLTKNNDFSYIYNSILKQSLFPSYVKLQPYPIKEITIPISVTSIENKAFMNCPSVEIINMSSSVTSFGEYCFSGCTSLKQIGIPSSLIYIGYFAFNNCQSLVYVEFPSSVGYIGKNVFNGCTSLKKVVINSPLQLIQDRTFYKCSSLEEFDIPSTVKKIGEYAFCGCSSLKRIEIPTSVNSILKGTFENCSSITQIKIPSLVASIGDEAFAGCTSLKQIEIPSSIKILGRDCFKTPQRIKIIKY